MAFFKIHFPSLPRCFRPAGIDAANSIKSMSRNGTLTSTPAAIETMAEKRALLERAAAENAWVCLEHDPVTAFARPRLEGHDFAWDQRIEAAKA